MYNWLALTLEQASRLDLYHREAYARYGIQKPLSLSAVKSVLKLTPREVQRLSKIYNQKEV